MAVVHVQQRCEGGGCHHDRAQPGPKGTCGCPYQQQPGR